MSPSTLYILILYFCLFLLFIHFFWWKLADILPGSNAFILYLQFFTALVEVFYHKNRKTLDSITHNEELEI